MTKTIAALILLLFVSVSRGGRTNRLQNECSMEAGNRDDSLFKQGNSYTYLYQGESEIDTSLGTYDSTGLMVKSKLIITPLPNYQIKLKMSDVEILDKISTDGNKFKPTPFSDSAKEILERNEVLFTRSGEEVKSICVNKNEPIWATNMKKSIIDILANNGKLDYEPMKTRHGNCFVRRMVDKDRIKTVSYELKSCKSGVAQSLFTDLTEAIVFNQSFVQCKYDYRNKNNLQTIHCTEDFVTIPMRVNGNSVNVRVITRLERTESKEIDISFPTENMIKTEITMENDPGETSEKHFKDTKETIKLMCKLQVSAMRSVIPRTFMTLVNQLKKLTPAQVKQIYMDVLKTDMCPGQTDDIRTIFYDAIGFVNTPAATSVMVDLIKTKQISDLDQTVWFTSLSFMKTTPTLDMIKDLESLLQTAEINKQMYLGISAVTHLYCKRNYDSCLMDHTIRNILSFYLKNIGQDCASSKDSGDLSKILISLKSLGNLKLFNEDVVAILSKCISTKSNPTAVRVSALEVMKHMDCSKDRSVAMEILEKNENDSEMRINSYLTVMGCPNIDTMFKVREILLKEKVNQVGSFIWTHLTNIQESNDQLKADIQKLLNDVELKNEFDISKLKFSRNIEKTFSIDQFDMTVDSNVIFSEKSFIPRSLSLNTTVTVLERPTNFIEVSARMEGLDDLLFKLLGPEGYLKKKNSASSAEDNIKLIKMLEDVNGNFNFKLFGQQISFVELLRGSLSSVRKYNIIEELMKLGQGQSIELKKNLVLLDNVATIPTSLGFPLKFKVQGSVSVALKIKSKLDLSGLMTWPIALNVESEISPSIMSEYNAEMIIETPFSSYGMTMTMKSGTDTEVKVKVSANKNEEFTIKFDTPKSKQEIVSVSGKAFVIYQTKEIEQLTNKLQKFELCSPEKVTRLFGVKLCGKAEFTDTKTRKSSLFYGPFSANIYIEKEDSQTGYVINGLLKTVPYISESGITYHSRFIKFEMDTPGSKKYSRKFTLEMSLDFKDKLIKLELDTPWKQALLKSSFQFTDEQKRINALFEIDSKKIVQVGLEHLSLITKIKTTEKGMLTFTFMDLAPFETKWMFNGKKDKWTVKFDSKGLLQDNTKFAIEVKEVETTRELAQSNKYKLSGSYEMYFGKGKIFGVASENYYGHRWDVTLNHSPRENPKSNYLIKYRHKTENKSSKSLLKYFLTSTISYGETAENFVKFRIENELSGRHMRASVKTSYGTTDKSSEEIDMQLYGGFTWKDDERHYAEGSLSFKFPSKGVNYEGRYNSEVGKRIFKLSMVLDKDQQSKMNLKINYLQPKLYLIDTELDVAFTLPNHNVNVNWDLKEVDVNKYKYALIGKYNNHVMKVNGAQTEISKLKYDSSIRMVMPSVKYWPEKINIDLRVDFVNPSSSALNGKLEIPNTNHKYALDLKLSSIPQNFLQLPLSEKSSVFKYKLQISNMERTVESESIFTCNPEEMQVFFNFAWNARQNKDQKVTFNFHTTHKSPNFKQFDNSALIAVHYPGNSHSLGFKSEFKFTELLAQIDMTWNRNQKISVITTYQIDNSWTEKGLKASITMKTPFPGLEMTHLGINAMGQLRYRKVDIEFKWAGNKKILFDIVVQPRSSNDFTLTSKLVTPFSGMNLISLDAKHISTANSITSEASLELGPSRRYNIKFEGINNNEGRNRDIGSNLQIESGVFPPLKMAFLHKDDTVHFKSQFDLTWMKTESINIKNDFSYTLEDNELITNGNVELQSTIEVIKQMKASWSMENKESTFLNIVQLLYKSKNIFQNSIKGFFEKDDTSFKLEFSGFMRLLSNDPLKISNLLSYQKGQLLINNFSVLKDTTPAYSHNLSIKRNEISMKMLILSTEFKTLEYKMVTTKEGYRDGQVEMWMKIGERLLFKEIIKMTSFDSNGQSERKMIMELYSEYLGYKMITSAIKIKWGRDSWKIEMEAVTKDSILGKCDIGLSIDAGKVLFNFLLKTYYRQLDKIEFELYAVTNQKQPFVNRLELNINNDMKFQSKIIIMERNQFDVDILYQYKTYSRYIRAKYDIKPTGFQGLLESNLFHATLKMFSTNDAPGGVALHSTLRTPLTFLKSLDIIGRFSTKYDQLDIIYKTPTIRNMDEIIKFKYLNQENIYRISVNTQALISTTLTLDLKEFKKIFFEFRTLTPESPSTIDIKFDYEGGFKSVKHSNELKLSMGKVNFHLENIFGKVKRTYVMFESKLKTNIPMLANYKVGLEYKQRPGHFEIDVNSFYNEHSVKLATKLIPSPDLKIEFKIETSFPILREIIFDIKYKQNKKMTQVLHLCKLSFMSNDRKFLLENKVEWSDTNYIEYKSSIVARTSQNSYFIRPRSIHFVHQFLRNKLKEVINMQFSEETQFKANLELPLALQSNGFLQWESSLPQLKKIRIATGFDFLDQQKKTIVFEVVKDETQLFKIEGAVIEKENKVSAILKINEVRNHAVELEYERQNSVIKNLGLKVESAVFSEVINLKVRYDAINNEGSVMLTGIGKNVITFDGKISKNNVIVKMKYGVQFAELELLVNIDTVTLRSRLNAGNVFALDVEILAKSAKFAFVFNDNFIKVAGILNQEIEIDINVLKTVLSTKFKVISTAPYKYELSGKTNFSKWTSFNADVYLVQGPFNFELTSRFTREDTDIYSINLRLVKESFKVKYESIFELAKSGELTVVYQWQAKKLSVKFEAETINQKTMKMNLEIDETTIEGRMTSPFDWMKDVTVKGELRQDKDEITGSFYLNHNMIVEPLRGKLSYKLEFASWEISIETPMTKSFDKLSLTKKTKDGKISIELRDNENQIFSGSLDINKSSKSELSIDVNCPGQIADFKLTLNIRVNVNDAPYVGVMTLKSNLVQDVSLNYNIDPSTNSFLVQFLHPTKQGSLTVKISNNLTSLTSEYNGKKTSLEIVHEMKGPFWFNGKIKVESNMYSSSPLKFELSCKHIIELPKKFEVGLQTKWNEATVFSMMIDWTRDNVKSFDLKTKFMLTPYQRKYQSSFELSNKKGEEYMLIYSPMGASSQRDITVKLVNQVGNIELLVNTPYDIVRSCDLKIKTDFSDQQMKQMITLESNYVGKLELLSEIKKLSPVEWVMTSQLKSPYRYGNIQAQIKHRREPRNNMVEIKVELDKEMYEMLITIKPEIVNLKMKSPIQWLKTFEILTNDNVNSYEITTIWNEYRSNIAVYYGEGSYKMVMKTNTDYAKVLSLSLEQTVDSSNTTTVSLCLTKDDKKINVNFNSKDSVWSFKLENSLLPNLPDKLKGVLSYSQQPLILQIAITKESKLLFTFVLDEKELLFHTKTELSEIKLHVTRSRFEVIVLSSKIFSILISQSSDQQIEMALMLNDTQYSSNLRFKNDDNKFHFKVTAHKNSLDKIFEFFVDIKKREQEFDSELTLLTKLIMKLKLSDKTSEKRMISAEVRLLFVSGVFDLELFNQKDVVDCKFFWNIKVDEAQLSIGSVGISLKLSSSINISFNLNFQSGAYQFQLSQLENLSYNIKMITPYKDIDFDLTILGLFKSWTTKFMVTVELKNKMIGEYDLKIIGQFTRDPEIKIEIGAGGPILKIDIKVKTTGPEKYSISAIVRVLDWKKSQLLATLENKDNIKIIFKLTTPFKLLKEISVEKTLWLKSAMEHKYQTIMTYTGIKNIKYAGGHEISFIKRIITFNGNLETEEIKIISIKVHGSRNEQGIDHLVIVDLKERRYGYRINGRFLPLFEGMTEIYTPFHNSGSLILQGRQIRNGFKIQAGKDRKQMAALEYSSSNEIKFVKLTPPIEYGKPLAARFRLSRQKRRAGDLFQTGIKYGDEELLDVFGKLNNENNNKKLTFKIKSPFSSQKSAEINLQHRSEGDKTYFSHHLKLNNELEKMYKLFGNYYNKDYKNFKYAINLHHPTSEPMHLSFGHNIEPNTHNSYLQIRRDNKIVFLHNGKLMFELKKINGEFEAQIPNRHYRIVLSHNGDLDQFQQDLSGFYNTEPYITYKANIVPEKRSIVEIDLPVQDGRKLRLTFDRLEKKIAAIFSTKSNEYRLESVDKDGEFKATFQINDQMMSSFVLGYGTKPMFVTAKYLKHSINVETVLKESTIIVKCETSSQLLKSASLRLRKNKVFLEINQNDEPLSFSLEYHFVPNNFFIVMETSWKPLSKVAIYVTPSEVKVNVNEYFQIFRYTLSTNNAMLESENNFYVVRNFRFAAKHDRETSKVDCKLEVNSYIATTELYYSADKLTINVDNNKFSPRKLKLELSRKRDSNLRLWLLSLTDDKIEIVKCVAQITESKYSLGLETNFLTAVVFSFDSQKNQLIISTRNGQRYLNLIGKVQRMISADSSTFVLDTSIDSSCFYLQKSAIQISYTSTKTSIYVSLTGQFNKQNFGTKSQMTNTDFLTSAYLNENIYSIRISSPTSQELTTELKSPSKKVNIVMKNMKNQYSMAADYNGEEVGKMLVTQNLDISSTFDHSSQIWYRKNKVWELTLKTDFKKYEMIMKQPTEISVVLKYEWKTEEGRIMSVWTKYWNGRELLERGMGMNINLTPNNNLVELYVENNAHNIKISRKSNYLFDTQVSIKLSNKLSKQQWALTIQSLKNEKIEIHWAHPDSNRAIKFHQIVKDNVKTFVELEISELGKLTLKSNDKTNVLSGSLSLFGKKVATIESTLGRVKAIFNDGGPESERLTVEWIKTTKGEWMKDYLSTTRLIVKQEAMKIDMYFEQEMKMEALLYSVETKRKYTMMDGSIETWNWATIVDFRTPDSVSIELKNPIMPLKTILRRHQPNKSSLRYDMETIWNTNEKISGFLEISLGTDLGFTSRLLYNPEKQDEFIQIHAKYLDDRQIEVRIFTAKKEQTVDYFQILLRLLNEHNFETTFQYRPDGLSQLQLTLLQVSTSLTDRFVDIIAIRDRRMSFDLMYRYKQLVARIPGGEMLERQLIIFENTIKVEILSIFLELDAMIKNDEFFIRTVSTAIVRRLEMIFYRSVYVYMGIVQMIEGIDFNFLLRFINYFNCNVSKISWHIASRITNPLKGIIVRMIDNYFPSISKNVIEKVKYLVENLAEILTTIHQKMVHLTNLRKVFVLNQLYSITVRMRQILKDSLGFITSGSLHFLYQEKEIKAMYDDAIQKLDAFSKRITNKLKQIPTVIPYALSVVAGDKYCEKLSEVFGNIANYLISQLKDEENQKIAKRFIMESMDDSFLKVNMKISRFIKNLIIPRYIVIYPECVMCKDIKYGFMVTTPIPLNDIKSIPDFSYVTKKIDEVKDIIQVVKNLLTERMLTGYQFIEFLRWFTPQLPIGSFPSFIPEFESYATILGSSVVTFDKRTLQLTPDLCTVTLTKDLRFKKWEIALNQNKNGRFYTIMIGSDKIEIAMKESKVSVNRKAVELPLIIGSTKVIAFGSVIKVKDVILGLTITVDPINDMFTVGISGWYHGNVRGLFGTADNEPFNDMMDDNDKMLSAPEFFKTYSKGDTACQIRSDAETEISENKDCPFIRRLVCNFLYRCPFSPMAACFEKVDPTRFFKSCIRSSDTFALKLDPSVCQSVRTYQSQCATAGIKIPVPPPCRKCDVKDEKSLSVGETRTAKIKEKVVDIVFVIDEGKCLKNIRTQLNNIISKIDDNLKEKGISSVRFGLVTFRGDGISEAHTHTVNQQLFGSKEEMMLSTGLLQSTEQTVGDTVGALTLASKYPFRNHASKHLIMINCERCEESSSLFKNMIEVLENKAIQFSMLMDYNFQVKESDSKKMIFGVDPKNIYTTMSWRGEVASNIETPVMDYCYQLTMKRNGVVFDINYLINKNEGTQKRFIETFSTQVSLTAIPARTTICKCFEDGEYNCVPLDIYAIFPVKKST